MEGTKSDRKEGEKENEAQLLKFLLKCSGSQLENFTSKICSHQYLVTSSTTPVHTGQRINDTITKATITYAQRKKKILLVQAA